MKGNHHLPLQTAKRGRREQSDGSSRSISATSKATSQPQAPSSSQRTEATHRFRLGPPFPAGRTAGLCVSMSRELLSGQIQPWNPCKAAVTQRAWPVPRCDHLSEHRSFQNPLPPSLVSPRVSRAPVLVSLLISNRFLCLWTGTLSCSNCASEEGKGLC